MRVAVDYLGRSAVLMTSRNQYVAEARTGTGDSQLESSVERPEGWRWRARA
jgi:hypothetical protein